MEGRTISYVIEWLGGVIWTGDNRQRVGELGSRSNPVPNQLHVHLRVISSILLARLAHISQVRHTIHVLVKALPQRSLLYSPIYLTHADLTHST